ncbi:SIR2 family protein [Leuconostoc gasicomitatum]|uniref:SIR2 family protein n=1 Tax=Leuconostoc gasicomitatum TaxID=115778 RepID=UPI001CC39D26|nr:SIR2 family protein [Leuconostoc gasicomitatum]
MLESALKDNNRNPDVKITIDNLAQNLNNRDAIVYKMHGDQSRPEDAVITKDDYEEYNISHNLFTTALKGDLVSKTFLFIGFSFEDPNLEYALSRVRIFLSGQTRNHYCFFKGMDRSDYLDDDGKINEPEFQRDKIRQNLKINDLERFGINVILLNSYDEIPGILEAIEKQYLYNSIFISGSIQKPENNWNTNSINNFCYNLSKKIVENDWKILSGFGLGIGSNIINGALETIYENKFKNLNDYLSLHPFPQVTPKNKTLPDQWAEYRKNIISESGICIFIFGNKEQDGKTVNAAGMIQEYDIAKEMNKLIIPTRRTGGASEDIYDDMYKHKDNYPYLTDYWSDLDTDNPTKLQDTSLKIIATANVI